jgi:pimeloyl-ACP methyl ester carboxylesterase
MEESAVHRPLNRLLLVAPAILLVPLMTRAQTVRPVRSEPTTVRSLDGRTMPAELVRLTVPERRTQPGRTVTVAALRLSTTAAHPGHPVVFLMGGPGIPGTVMAPIPPYFTLFQRLRELGDVIIVDQRGIGSSEPALDCPFEGTLPVDAFVDTDRLVAALRQQVAACADHWRAQGAEPTAYNTVESADDIDDLRQALGIEKVDLLAFSYGTRLALAVVQRHRAHVGRVVLQGVNGPGLVVKRPGPVTRKLQRLSEVLKQDTGWHAPTDLLVAARTARDRLERAPAAVTVDDRRSGQPVALRIGRPGLDAIVALNLDDARLPALLVSAATGDDRVLTRFVETAWNGLTGGSVGLMARAVNCAADRPDARWRVAARESTTAPFGAPIDNAFLTTDFCRAVGYGMPPVEFPRPVRSAVPVLMLTGTLDATNPIENARDVARGLGSAAVLEVENAAHEALTVPAVQDVVVGFLSGTDVRGRRIAAPMPHFATIAEALQATPQRAR